MIQIAELTLGGVGGYLAYTGLRRVVNGSPAMSQHIWRLLLLDILPPAFFIGCGGLLLILAWRWMRRPTI